MAYKVTETHIPDLLILEPTVFGDERGFFMEAFNQRDFNEAVGFEENFVQDNHSRSKRGVLRGLHYQMKQPQGKLVRVTNGSVFDVAVDLRDGSNSHGKWFGLELSAQNKKQLWIPAGFAHGFVVLSEYCDFLYKATDYYNPSDERCIIWNDPTLAIDWQISPEKIALSKKDLAGQLYKKAESITC